MKCTRFALCCLLIIFFDSLHAQQPRPVKVAVLAPLYLDSAFTDYIYQLGDKSIPQYILTGLDFYNGVMLAVDSLQKENANIEVWVYDTKKEGTDINAILKGMSFLNFSMMVVSLNNPAEQKSVSDFSFANNIPVISATYPNDANITANPFFVLLNSTLKAHIDGIYKYVQQNYSAARPVFITRNGILESKIFTDFKENDSLPAARLRYRTLTLNDDISIENLIPYLDSNKTNVLICGSLNTEFAGNIAETLCQNPQYRTVLIGMPNWDGIHHLNKLNCGNIEIIYSSPYNFSRTDSTGYHINQVYHSKFFARPSDMVYKGYEAMYHFTHLLLDYKNEFINHLSDNKYIIANNFYFSPVILPDSPFVPAYQENKNLYFIRKTNGLTVSVSKLFH